MESPGLLLNERTQFLVLCARAYNTQKILVVQAMDSKSARSLRKRFYRLRDDIPHTVDGRAFCDKVSFKVIGRLVKVVPDIDLGKPFLEPTGVSHGTQDQGQVPRSNRLDNQG